MTSILYPVATEKALGKIDAANTITLVVDSRSDKKTIKKEFEDMFSVKVASINTSTTIKNKKKAYLKLAKDYKASDIARKLKLV